MRGFGSIPVLVLLLGVLACGDAPVLGGGGSLQADPSMASGAARDAGRRPEPPSPAPIDLSGGPLRIIEVPPGGTTIVHTPHGYFALGGRTLGGKAITGAKTGLYRAADGVHWTRVRLPGDETSLMLTGLAFGAGRLVMVGRSFGEDQLGEIFTSEDGEQWDRMPGPDEYTQLWREVVHVGERFFAIGGFRTLGVSSDGLDWRTVPIGLAQVMGIAYGADRYVMVGSGGIESSSDGLVWEPRPTGCELAGACVTDPSGNQGPILFDVIFAQGRFVAGPFESPDGVAWSATAVPSPGDYVDGHYFKLAGAQELVVTYPDGTSHEHPVVRPAKEAVMERSRSDTWIGRLDFDEPLPDTVDASFEDGLTCDEARCLLLGGRMYLVPPPGTPPLPDRTPRDADGGELLTDECPVSTMVFCDDYTTRVGCRCERDAPRGPHSCEHVGAFACEGELEPRQAEWHVAEVGPAGCHCDHVDPGQPASFGAHCVADPGVCLAPLTCETVRPTGDVSCCQPISPPRVCTATCTSDADCPSWEGTGFCAGPVRLRCEDGVCQPPTCER